MIKRFALVFLISSPSFAMFCPSNFSSIDIGNSIAQVQQLCGAPDSQNTYSKPIYASEEWTYYVNTTPFNPTTQKLNVVLNNNQVVNITTTVNVRKCQPLYQNNLPTQANNNPFPCNAYTTQETQSVGSTALCGLIFSVGDTGEKVKTACGEPVFVNHSQDSSAQVTITEFHYNGPPVTTLIFENGVLKTRQQ